jgi:N-formylglutamate amidohydrolase
MGWTRHCVLESSTNQTISDCTPLYTQDGLRRYVLGTSASQPTDKPAIETRAQQQDQAQGHSVACSGNSSQLYTTTRYTTTAATVHNSQRPLHDQHSSATTLFSCPALLRRCIRSCVVWHVA